jgi:hypothetical protein
MTIQIEHTLSKEEARNRIDQLIERYKEEYKGDLQELLVDWAGDRAHIRMKAKGYGTSGNLDVRDRVVELDFYVPFMLFLMRYSGVWPEEFAGELAFSRSNEPFNCLSAGSASICANGGAS